MEGAAPRPELKLEEVGTGNIGWAHSVSAVAPEGFKKMLGSP